EAILAGQHDVQDQQIDAALRHAFECARAGQHVLSVVGLKTEVVTQHLTELTFVFGDQDPATHEDCSMGKRTVNELPQSRPRLSACTEPPCATTISCTRCKPRPVPPLALSSPRKNGSNACDSSSSSRPRPESRTTMCASPCLADREM